jgi:hypothetical protein
MYPESWRPADLRIQKSKHAKEKKTVFSFPGIGNRLRAP